MVVRWVGMVEDVVRSEPAEEAEIVAWEIRRASRVDWYIHLAAARTQANRLSALPVKAVAMVHRWSRCSCGDAVKLHGQYWPEPAAWEVVGEDVERWCCWHWPA